MLSPTELTELKKILCAMRTEIMDALQLINHASEPVELDQNKVGRLSRIDAIQGQAMAQASAHRQRNNLALIEQAIMRLEQDDSYGRCFECDQWIALGRLMIDPMTHHCIDCAATLEC